MGIKNIWVTFRGSRSYRIIRNKYFIATTVFVLLVIFGDNSLLDLYRVARRINEQEVQKAYYKELITSTEEMLNELSSNKDSLEKFAREQYFFKEPDEDVFILERKR